MRLLLRELCMQSNVQIVSRVAHQLAAQTPQTSSKEEENMSNYYVPWAHAMHLFFSRSLQFLSLSLLVGLAVWANLLHLVFEADWKTVAMLTWSMWRSTDPRWWVILAQSMVIGVLVTAWLSTWLITRARMRCGERHHRGAHVLDAPAD